MKRIILILILMLSIPACRAQFIVNSPDTTVHVLLKSNRERKGVSRYLVPTRMNMQISFDNYEVINEGLKMKQRKRTVVLNKEIGLTVKSNGRRYAFGKSELEKYYTMAGTHEEPIAGLKGDYNRAVLTTEAGITLEILVFNEGMAYRFKVSEYPDDYKILEVCDVFPHEKPIAILGTFTGDYVMPWRCMYFKNNKLQSPRPEVLEETFRPATKIVSWRDALSSFSVGTHFSWYYGGAWQEVSQDQNIAVDLTYKHLYGGISFTPCHEILYVRLFEDYEPFNHIYGSIHSWSVSGRFGYNLPIQNGYEIYNISPYIATSLMHLDQHRGARATNRRIDPHHYYLIGAGIKIQVAIRQRITFGIGYEHQFFTGEKCPKGMNSVLFSIGRIF